jgi:hypothetical protein
MQRPEGVIHHNQQYRVGFSTLKPRTSGGIHHGEWPVEYQMPNTFTLHKRSASTTGSGVGEEIVPIHPFAAQGNKQGAGCCQPRIDHRFAESNPAEHIRDGRLAPNICGLYSKQHIL